MKIFAEKDVMNVFDPNDIYHLRLDFDLTQWAKSASKRTGRFLFVV